MPPNINQQMRQILPPFLPLSVSKNLTTDTCIARVPFARLESQPLVAHLFDTRDGTYCLRTHASGSDKPSRRSEHGRVFTDNQDDVCTACTPSAGAVRRAKWA